jgi:hypothetical protein
MIQKGALTIKAMNTKNRSKSLFEGYSRMFASVPGLMESPIGIPLTIGF